MQTTRARIAADAAREVAKNAYMAVPFLRRRRLHGLRAGAEFTGTDEQLRRYAFQSLEVLNELAGGVRGKRVLEVGPGDFLTSGLSLLAAGAARYAAVDRFMGDYSRAEAKRWYAGIKAAWPRHYPDSPWPSWLDPSAFPEGFPDRVQTYGVPIERPPDAGRWDVVCSFQVGEHVSDIGAFARSTSSLLEGSGIAVHVVDFGPMDPWRAYSDPLTFLRPPQVLWRLMGSARGTANRRRVHEMVAAFEDAGLDVDVVDVQRVPASKTDLSKVNHVFRSMPEESVRTVTATLVARHRARPAQTTPEGDK